MNEIRPKLDALRSYASDLRKPGKKQTDQIKKEALAALAALETIIKEKNFDVVSWHEIYETIQPFNALDLSTPGSIIGTIQSIFTKTVSPKEQVSKLITFVDQKRKDSLILQLKM